MNPVLEQSLHVHMTSNARAYIASAELSPVRIWQHPMPDQREASRAACRLLNVLFASVGLILSAPIMLLVAVLVKLTSRGPAIFTQTRVGIDRRGPVAGEFASRRRVDYGGRLFKIYKFRTMTSNPNTTLQVWADPNDKRITSIGKFLRKYRLDELPQLVNVLKGDMNLVGPRPEQPNIFLSLHEQIHNYARRQRVLPGITGWAQVNQSYDQNVDDVRRKVAYDLEYIEKQSPITDLMIMAKTIPVVLLKRGGW